MRVRNRRLLYSVVRHWGLYLWKRNAYIKRKIWWNNTHQNILGWEFQSWHLRFGQSWCFHDAILSMRLTICPWGSFIMKFVPYMYLEGVSRFTYVCQLPIWQQTKKLDAKVWSKVWLNPAKIREILFCNIDFVKSCTNAQIHWFQCTCISENSILA